MLCLHTCKGMVSKHIYWMRQHLFKLICKKETHRGVCTLHFGINPLRVGVCHDVPLVILETVWSSTFFAKSEVAAYVEVCW